MAEVRAAKVSRMKKRIAQISPAGSQDQTLHSNKNFKNYLFRSVIISVEFILGLALAVCFQTFQYL